MTSDRSSTAERRATAGIAGVVAPDVQALRDRVVALEAGIANILGHGVEGTYAELIEPLVARFDVAAKFDQEAVHNATGSAAIAALLRSMAKKLDTAVARARALLTGDDHGK